MNAKQRVPALRGGQSDDLAANGSAAIEFRCGAPRRDGQSRPTDQEPGMSVKAPHSRWRSALCATFGGNREAPPAESRFKHQTTC
jgi:hypothetical protein